MLDTCPFTLQRAHYNPFDTEHCPFTNLSLATAHLFGDAPLTVNYILRDHGRYTSTFPPRDWIDTCWKNWKPIVCNPPCKQRHTPHVYNSPTSDLRTVHLEPMCSPFVFIYMHSSFRKHQATTGVQIGHPHLRCGPSIYVAYATYSPVWSNPYQNDNTNQKGRRYDAPSPF